MLHAALRYAGVVGCGALSLLGYVQTFYLSSQLSAAWLPQNYRQVAGKFGWSVGNIRCAAASLLSDYQVLLRCSA